MYELIQDSVLERSTVNNPFATAPKGSRSRRCYQVFPVQDKSVVDLKAGTKLTPLGSQDGWLWVTLEDGTVCHLESNQIRQIRQSKLATTLRAVSDRLAASNPDLSNRLKRFAAEDEGTFHVLFTKSDLAKANIDPWMVDGTPDVSLVFHLEEGRTLYKYRGGMQLSTLEAGWVENRPSHKVWVNWTGKEATKINFIFDSDNRRACICRGRWRTEWRKLIPVEKISTEELWVDEKMYYRPPQHLWEDRIQPKGTNRRAAPPTVKGSPAEQLKEDVDAGDYQIGPNGSIKVKDATDAEREEARQQLTNAIEDYRKQVQRMQKALSAPAPRGSSIQDLKQLIDILEDFSSVGYIDPDKWRKQ